MLPVSILIEVVVSTTIVQHTYKQLINNLKFRKYELTTKYGTRVDSGRYRHLEILESSHSNPIVVSVSRTKDMVSGCSKGFMDIQPTPKHKCSSMFFVNY